MEKITVPKDRLRETLLKNKQTHQTEFEEAWEAFRQRAIHNFEQRLKQAKNLKKGQMLDLWVNLPVPEDHTDDYEQAIQMLDWELGDEVSLTQTEFSQLIQDDWRWKANFMQTNAFYAK